MFTGYVLVFFYTVNPLTNNSSAVIPYPFPTLEQCKESGEDMKKQLGDGKYSCTIVYPPLDVHRTRMPIMKGRNND